MDENEKRMKSVVDNFKQADHLRRIAPKFEREKLNSPFAFIGYVSQMMALEDSNSPYSQFVRQFLEENETKN